MRRTKTREKVGYHLYIQDRHESEIKRESGHTEKRKFFERHGGLFASVQEARSYADSPQFSGRKIHIEGVRVNIVPLELPKRREEAETNTGTHR
jgi:hypothetical protein